MQCSRSVPEDHCDILRTVLYDALAEVAKGQAPMAWKVFVEEITACLDVQNEKVPGTTESVTEPLK